MLILLYGNTLVCWLVTFLPSVMRPISSEGRLRQGQMKLSSFQTFKQIFSRQFVILPEKNNLQQLWQFCYFVQRNPTHTKLRQIVQSDAISFSMLMPLFHQFQCIKDNLETRRFSKPRCFILRTFRGGQLQKITLQQKEMQLGRKMQCNQVHWSPSACLSICHNRRLVCRLIIHRRAIITPSQAPTLLKPHHALHF